MRIGIGYDVHRLVPGRALVLGGVSIPGSMKLLGHSDADVLCHALADALLGAAALGDIGQRFPDTDDSLKDISSLKILSGIMDMLTKSTYELKNADVTIVCQKPYLAPFIQEMRANLAEALSTIIDKISVKATTTEKTGPEGRGESISAHAVVLLANRPSLKKKD